jgi:small subunit ribosomal protein S6
VASSTYETLFILDSNHYTRDPGGVAKQINDIITEAGGTVLVSRLWMEQKLAYPIDKHQKGTYWLSYFEIEGDGLTKIARAFRLCEPVVRELTLKLEPRLVEPILANARGESVKTSLDSDAETEVEVEVVENAEEEETVDA